MPRAMISLLSTIVNFRNGGKQKRRGVLFWISALFAVLSALAKTWI